MNAVKTFFAVSLLQIHKGAFTVKLLGSLKLAIPLSVGVWFSELFTKWTVTNANYIVGVLGCIAIDHIIGSVYHFKKRDFTFKKNAIGLITKLALCSAAAVMFETIHGITREAPLVYEYLRIVTRLMVLLYPAGSAFMNMSALTNGVFPPLGWIKRIKAFNENLDLEKIKGSDAEKTE